LLGNNVWIGPKCVILNRLSIGDGSKVLMGPVVIRNVKENESVSGNFALPHDKHLMIDAVSLLRK